MTILPEETIYLISEVTEESARECIMALHAYDAVTGPITLFLSSPGGDEAMGWAIFDTIRSLRNTVRVVGSGGVYSIAALILCAGDERLLMPNATVMIHNSILNMGDTTRSNDIQRVSADALRGDVKYARALSKASGQPFAQVRAWCEAESYFDAKAAVKLGFADRLWR